MYIIGNNGHTWQLMGMTDCTTVEHGRAWTPSHLASSYLYLSVRSFWVFSERTRGSTRGQEVQRFDERFLFLDPHQIPLVSNPPYNSGCVAARPFPLYCFTVGQMREHLPEHKHVLRPLQTLHLNNLTISRSGT